jgi:hypothetical protein
LQNKTKQLWDRKKMGMCRVQEGIGWACLLFYLVLESPRLGFCVSVAKALSDSEQTVNMIDHG